MRTALKALALAGAGLFASGLILHPAVAADRETCGSAVDAG
jgi:hypothetical protein